MKRYGFQNHGDGKLRLFPFGALWVIQSELFDVLEASIARREELCQLRILICANIDLDFFVKSCKGDFIESLVYETD